jgi:hypothetical protein
MRARFDRDTIAPDFVRGEFVRKILYCRVVRVTVVSTSRREDDKNLIIWLLMDGLRYQSH